MPLSKQVENVFILSCRVKIFLNVSLILLKDTMGCADMRMCGPLTAFASG